MLPESVNTTLLHVWRCLEPLEFPVALIGGAAMTMWGHARFTKDVDFILGVATQNVSRVVDTLRQHRIVPRRYPPATPLGEVDLVQFDYQLPGSYIEVRVDLQFAKGEFHQQLLDRRVAKQIPGGDEKIDVVACEDLILLKLLAGRMIDLADAAYVLRYNAYEIDREYLQRWARQLRVGREMALIWDEAFPGFAPPQLPPADEDLMNSD